MNTITCENCGVSVKLSKDFSEPMIEMFREQFQQQHKTCKPKGESKLMAKDNGNTQTPEQLAIPMKPEEIKRLQQDLVRNILIVKNLSDDIADKKKAYNEVIKDKKKEIDLIAQTLKEQGGFGQDLEAALNGIRHQMAVAGELEA